MSQSGGIRGANISSSACGLTNSARVRISISCGVGVVIVKPVESVRGVMVR